MASSPDGKTLFASGGRGRNELWRYSLDGSDTPRQLATLETPIYEMVFDIAGQLWATTGGEGLLQLDPTTGRVLDSVGAGVSLGLAADPEQTALYVSTTGGIQRFDTATRKLTPFSEIRVDAMAIGPDGSLYGTAWPDQEEVLRFDFRGRAEAIATVDGGAESLAFGPEGSLLEGVLIVGHEQQATLSIVDSAFAATIGDRHRRQRARGGHRVDRRRTISGDPGRPDRSVLSGCRTAGHSDVIATWKQPGRARV